MDWMVNRDEVSQELIDLHVKLLRKLKRSVNPEKWEKAIVKFCYFYGGNNDAFELERFGRLAIIKNFSLSTNISIYFRLSLFRCFNQIENY